MEQRALKNVNKCSNTNIYSYLETSSGKSCNLYLNVVLFSMPVLIGHLWQLKTAVFLHWCLIRAVPLLANRTNRKLLTKVIKWSKHWLFWLGIEKVNFKLIALNIILFCRHVCQ
jgi:hypothetical protein